MPAPNDVRPDLWSALRGCRLWHAVSDEAVSGLARASTLTDVARGELLGAEGDTAAKLGVVVAGKVRVFYLGADGKRITFENLGASEPFGAIAALAGVRYPANMEAATPAVVAWTPREAVFEMLTGEPEVARSVITDLAGRLVNFTSVIQTMALDVPSRLARYLFQRSLAVGQTSTDGLHVDLGMSKAELAQAIGTVPETLSRAFARLKDDEILEVRGGTVVVFDVGALARIGSGYYED